CDGRRATSVSARYRIGAAACSNSQLSGNRTGAVTGGGPEIGERGGVLDGGGRGEEALAKSPRVPEDELHGAPRKNPHEGRLSIADFEPCARGPRTARAPTKSVVRGVWRPPKRPAYRPAARAATTRTLPEENAYEDNPVGNVGCGDVHGHGDGRQRAGRRR